MTSKDLLKLSTRMFTARRGRTLLTVLGMGIGFGAILFLVSLGYGMQGALLETITSSGGLTSLDVTANEQDGKYLDAQSAEEIGKMAGVEKVEASYNFNARIKIENTASDVRAEIATPGYLELENLKAVSGDTQKALQEENGKKIVVSAAVAKVFGKGADDLVGKNINFSVFVPEGNQDGKQKQAPKEVSAENFQIAGVAEGDDAILYVPSTSMAIPGDAIFSKLKAKCSSSDSLGRVKDEITQKGFLVSSLSETVEEVNKMFRFVNLILGLFGIVTLAVSAIGMFNTMTVALMERTREIGIMRSIGASRMDILLMFIIESTLMGFCGGIAGILLGIISGQSVNLIINSASRYFGGKTFSFFAYPVWFLGFILLFSVVIGFATGIGPAKRASSLDPLEALRSR